MEYSALQNKGFEIARRHENRPLHERMNLIAETFGCRYASIKTSPCTGKWRGRSDIFLRFDNGASLGMDNYPTPQAKTRKVQNECVNSTLARYNPEIVRELKVAATAALLKRESKDNAVAKEKGLKPYIFLNVELHDGSQNVGGGYLGWYYVTLAVGSKIIAMVETGLCGDIERGTVSEHLSRPKFFVAGGLPDASVDFVFNNVGHSSFQGMYQLPLYDDVRTRAERTLHCRRRKQQMPMVKLDTESVA